MQVSYRLPTIANKTTHWCDIKLVSRFREDSHIMIDSTSYAVSHNKRKHQLQLTNSDGAVTKLHETNATRKCVATLAPMRDFHIKLLHGGVIYSSRSDQFIQWDSTSTGATNTEHHSAHTGHVLFKDTILPSAAAHAACPTCSRLAGWDGEQFWFTNFVQHPVSNLLSFVAGHNGTFLSWPRENYMQVVKVSKSFLLALTSNPARVSLHNKTDGSLHRNLLVPSWLNSQCLDSFMSPDESRVLLICHWGSDNRLLGPIERSLLMEIDSDTGVLLKLSALPKIHGPYVSYYNWYGGDRLGDNALLLRAQQQRAVQIYAYPA